MTDDVLSRLVSDLNRAPGAALRVPRMAALVEDNNRRIADTPLPFDSTPYAFVQWLAEADRPR
ncbi:MAG TPA: hypothetical protein VKY22_02395 [Bradyrhizobium sp.]|nr:hypothetical protein [Bradyrhizobium sp.]